MSFRASVLRAALWLLMGILAGVTTPMARAVVLVGQNLYKLQFPPSNGFAVSAGPQTAAGGQVIGQSNLYHALLWSGPGAPIDLNPTDLSGFTTSRAVATDGQWQVGVGNGGTSTIANAGQALLWHGTAASAVNLNPTNLVGFTESVAQGVYAGQQVGYGSGPGTGGNSHALLWTGSADTAIDLNPTNLPGFTSSAANATDGKTQGGYGYDGSSFHPMLWSGSADSAVDLQPAWLPAGDIPWVTAIADSQQVGFAQEPNGNVRALLWQGTADSAVDLTPAGETRAFAYGTNGSMQVGEVAVNYIPRAAAWTGTADSYVDLQALLPASMYWSVACSIDSNGIIYGFASAGADGIHAVQWVPVPEPSTACVLGIGASLFMQRRGRRLSPRNPP